MKRALLRAQSALAMVLVLASTATYAERIVLLDQKSKFQRLIVVEDTVRRERYLYSEDQNGLQGLISLRRPEDLGPQYLRSSLLGLVFAPENPSAMLFVGLGTGSLPRYLTPRYPRTRLDAVEIDPDVPPIARRYFELPAARNLNVVVAEGREFIRASTRKYDYVLMDAYFSAELPAHLATLEFVGELRRVLKPGGVVVANLVAPEYSANFWSVLKTYQAGFPHVRVFATESPVNLILIASGADLSRDPASMQKRIGQLKSRHRIEVDLAALAARSPAWRTAPAAAPILRDAPLR